MNYPAKILLFGEYALLAGRRGFAMPFTHYNGSLKMDAPAGPQAVDSNRKLQELFNAFAADEYVKTIVDWAQFGQDLDNGLWFDSSIPSGYGVGSSGALVAAIYDRYKKNANDDLFELKGRLAGIEKFFHGSSSGIDPSVSILKKPLLVHDRNTAEVMELWETRLIGLNVYLVDTGSTSNTMGLVKWFEEKINDPDFYAITEQNFFTISDEIIGCIEFEQPVIFDDVMTVSDYQFHYMKPMIPDSFMQHFEYGVKTREFAFKLCGSGGGGYMLCFSRTRSVENYFSQQQLDYITVVKM